MSSGCGGDLLQLNLPGEVSLEMVWCPPGDFLMGSFGGVLWGLGAEKGRYFDEARHRVRLTQGFWMAKYAVTQEQYEALAGCNLSSAKSARLPVDCVSWDDALEYGQKLSKYCQAKLPSGYAITLPTEAQWEYACRAGSAGPINSGRPLCCVEGLCPNLSELAWYNANSNNAVHEVGLKQGNAWGLYDMHGNVWEWCADWHAEYPFRATDPLGPDTGVGRVFRGGSFAHGAKYCRSASRFALKPESHCNYLGFRLACRVVSS